MTESPALTGSARRAEIAANLADFRARVDDAARGCGRDVADVHLIAVTKTFPASDLRLIADLGVLDVGENRDQEAHAKHELCADLGVRWHFVGGLQRNKCRSVASYADVVHSVDRVEVVSALSRGAGEADRTVDVLVQVSLAGDPGAVSGRSGVAAADVPPLAAAVAAAPGLTLAGVMAVAPLGADPDVGFAELAVVARSLQEQHPTATMISAGMSGDFESAIRHGATHLRVGTALLGPRGGRVR